MQSIVDSFNQNGYVIVRALSSDECKLHIEEQVRNLLLRQPWTDTLVVRDYSGNVLDIDRDTSKYISVLTSPVDSYETLAHYRSVAPFHAGFGACCDPSVFHLPRVWALRERMYDTARAILGQDDLWSDINRSIYKLPGEGEHEFLHWDIPFLHMRYARDDCLAGKVAYTPMSFVCVPGTHLEHQKICAAYGPLYPNAKATDAKLALDPKKPDPLNLVGRRVSIPLAPGDAVFWSKWLLHGVEKNPLAKKNKRDSAGNHLSGGIGSIQFGTYIGFMPAVDRPEYKRKAGVSEREDRIASYVEGRAPVLWPSLDRIWYYPFRYVNFHRMLVPYLAKTRPDWPGLTTRVVKSGPNKGMVLPDIVPVPDPHYTPPKLSALGEKLLGLKTW
jgi:Phytanoyl-CoA dioxygenase (PhyH)